EVKVVPVATSSHPPGGQSATCPFGQVRGFPKTGRASEKEEPKPGGVGDRLAARLRAELSEDRVHVELRGVLADSEPLADAPIREALGEELEHLALAGGERLDERLARDPRAHHGFV